MSFLSFSLYFITFTVLVKNERRYILLVVKILQVQKFTNCKDEKQFVLRKFYKREQSALKISMMVLNTVSKHTIRSLTRHLIGK